MKIVVVVELLLHLESRTVKMNHLHPLPQFQREGRVKASQPVGRYLHLDLWVVRGRPGVELV
jgi:hypothetical protein